MRSLVDKVDARRRLRIKPLRGIDAIRGAATVVPSGIATAAGGGAGDAEQSPANGGGSEESNPHAQHLNTPLREQHTPRALGRRLQIYREETSKPLRSARILSNKINPLLAV